ncbi:hypothetical protein WV31_10690 [Magnetospirillum sp. ME-1]|uniref:hypothetical protein n=1 Tax=Magnetospirillum sp. ME-1 TaxID=1639348 RepID=UPI000A17A878|nr:hypothetical protein [Magnetospirillum sp. ME-1]ARJ66094.1 hypothetical protein WV31_10690 [Magnetospirillum sp. ME-1]
MTPVDIERIGQALYPGVSYRGRPAWRAWLADGLEDGGRPLNRRRVREWTSGAAAIPAGFAQLLELAEPLADRLALATLPRGTRIRERMAEVIAQGGGHGR